MAKSEAKTNVMRLLDSKKISYNEYTYEGDSTTTGVEVAAMLGQEVERVFKTLVTVGKSGANYVFVIPVSKELDLKKAAAAAHEKSIDMLKSKDLLALTGYVHGGCSPIGMKKQFVTFVHESAKDFDKIIFSGGRIGYQVELSTEDLSKVIRISFADVIKQG